MRWFTVAAVVAVLFRASAPPAFGACVNPKKCPDAAAIEKARQMLQNTCGCTQSDQTHGKYTQCVKKGLKAADITAPCRKLIMKCEKASICGKPNGAVCCALNKHNLVKASIVPSASGCKGSACGPTLGLFSKFDACATDGTCAGQTTTPSGGSVLKGALTATLGRFNFNGALGLPGALAACHTSFGDSTHVCTYADLQSAQAAGNLVGLKDTASMAVTAFWAIDNAQPPLQQCNDDAPGTGSGLNWEYGTAHTMSRGQKVALDNGTGALGPLQSGQQCAILGTPAWVGCCQ